MILQEIAVGDILDDCLEVIWEADVIFVEGLLGGLVKDEDAVVSNKDSQCRIASGQIGLSAKGI